MSTSSSESIGCPSDQSAVPAMACAFFEATQLAGFTEKESLGFFGSPPEGYSLTIEPQPAPVAQARYLERYRVLAGAVGLIPADDAWHTE